MLNKITSSRIVTAIAAILVASLASAAEPKTSDGWQPLFNGKDLRGWQVVLTENTKGIDPATVFQVHDDLIHAYKDVPQGAGVPIGFLASDDSYSWHHLKLEYRWVGKRFAPRVARVRDAGLLYHATAEKKVWPRCIECQIQEQDVGDCFLVNGTQVETTVDPAQSKADSRQYLPAKDGGVADIFGGPKILRIIKGSTHEVDDWNTVEVLIRGGEEVIHRVNDHEVFRAKNLKQLGPDDKTWIPLTSGRILLQCEYAEVQYRNVQIKPIPGGPFRVPDAKPTVEVKPEK